MKTKTLRQKLSFQEGYAQIKIGEVEKVTYEIMSNVLGITKKQTFTRRMSGGYFSPVEIKAIEEIFNKYGVTINIWTEL